MVDTYLELLSPWQSTAPGRAEFQMPTYAAAENVPSLLQAAGLQAPENFVCVTPGAGWATKLWPTDRFAAVARHIKTRHDLRTLVLWAGDSERVMAEEIAMLSESAAVVAPKTSLTRTSRDRPEIKTVSRWRHRPTSYRRRHGNSMHWFVRSNVERRSGPYGPLSVSIQSPRLPTKRGMRRGDNSAMLAIEIDEVQTMSSRLLQSSNVPAATPLSSTQSHRAPHAA